MSEFSKIVQNVKTLEIVSFTKLIWQMNKKMVSVHENNIL